MLRFLKLFVGQFSKHVDHNLSSVRNGRTIISFRQQQLLKGIFDNNKFPSREEKLTIAQLTGLDITVITNWFQNKRARSRVVTDMLPENKE